MYNIDRSAPAVLQAITLPALEEEFGKLAWPVNEAMECHLAQAIEVASQEVGAATLIAADHDLAQAEAQAQASQEQLAEATRRLTETETELQHAAQGSLTKSLIFWFCAAACFGAEFAFTLVTLPFLLNLPPDSVLGILVAIAPTTALVILDLVFARLFEDPWQKMQSLVQRSRWHKAALVSLMAGFLVTLAVFNLYTVKLLALAREEATEFHFQLTEKTNGYETALLPNTEARAATVGAPQEPGKESTVAHAAPESGSSPIIRETITAISVTVAIDGALLLLLALGEGRRCRRRWQLTAQARTQRKLRETLAQMWHEHEAAIKVCQRVCTEAPAQATRAAARFKEQRLFQLEQTLAQLRERRSTSALVETLLAGQPRLTKGPRKIALAT